MVVAACEMKIMIYESNSLKDKRQIIKSIIGRIQSRFNVSIAEVGFNDNWNFTVLGVAYVTNHNTHANEMMQNIIKFIDRDCRVEIIDYNIELM